jgi:hypothetical protein
MSSAESNGRAEALPASNSKAVSRFQETLQPARLQPR